MSLSALTRLPRLAFPRFGLVAFARPLSAPPFARRPLDLVSRRYSAMTPPPPSGPKWNSRRVLITLAASLIAVGSAGFGWLMVEDLTLEKGGPDLSNEDGVPGQMHNNGNFPKALHAGLETYKQAYDAKDYPAAAAALLALSAAAAELPVEEFTGAPAFISAMGKRRVGQELSCLLAEVMIHDGRVAEAWMLVRDELTELGPAPFTSWPEGPVTTADQFDAVLSMARELARGARIVPLLDDIPSFPAQGGAELRAPRTWSEAAMHYDYLQAEAMIELGLAHLDPEARAVRDAFRPSEEGESIAILNQNNRPEYQEEARQNTATKLRLLADALYRDDQRALAKQYLELAYTLCDPASRLANHLTLLGAALAQEQLAETVFVTEYLDRKAKGTSKTRGCFSKPLRHLHNTLALLELAEQMAESAETGENKSFHTAQVTPVRLQTYYHLAMYENNAAESALADLNHLAAEAGTPILDELPKPVDGKGRELDEVAATLGGSQSWGWLSRFGGQSKGVEGVETSESAGLIPPPRWA